jgi:hypothetical protein
MQVDGDRKWETNTVKHEEDPVVASFDVYLTQPPPDQQPCLLQFPLNLEPRSTSLNNINSAKLRPRQLDLQFTVGFNRDSQFYNHHHANPAMESFSDPLLQSSPLPIQTNYVVGVRSGTALYLIPVDKALQLRHSFKYLGGN